DGKIGLVRGTTIELARQTRVSLRRLREQNGARGHLVDPVDRDELLASLPRQPDEVAFAALADDGNSGRLVHDEDKIILERHAGASNLSPLVHAQSLH